jgi:predicted regulator of Ras-like GTPase activity (Roadblock/LC7/MglB family)
VKRRLASAPFSVASLSDAAAADHALGVVLALLVDLDGAAGILVASADGVQLAHGGRLHGDPERLAAMASSVAALSDTAGRETGIGSPRCTVIESNDGRLVVRGMPLRDRAVVVAVLTGRDLPLDRVSHSMAAAEARAALQRG